MPYLHILVLIGIRIQITETELEHDFTRIDNFSVDINPCSITEITAGRGWINYLFSMYISLFVYVLLS